MTKSRITSGVLAVGMLLGLSACTNPYDPVQRTIGGGLIGAGSGRQSVPPLPVDMVLLSAPQSAEQWAR
jgi:hypothetical protein